MSDVDLGKGGPSLWLLDRLVSKNLGSIKYDTNEKWFEGGGTMTFRSGFNRLFKQEKSSQDIETNRTTLNTLMDFIKSSTNDQVHDKVLNGRTYLPGDDRKEGYTVQERIDRGSYVSSNLVGQLRQLTHEAIRSEQSQEGRIDQVGVGPNEQDNSQTRLHGFIDQLPPNKRREAEEFLRNLMRSSTPEEKEPVEETISQPARRESPPPFESLKPFPALKELIDTLDDDAYPDLRGREGKSVDLLMNALIYAPAQDAYRKGIRENTLSVEEREQFNTQMHKTGELALSAPWEEVGKAQQTVAKVLRGLDDLSPSDRDSLVRELDQHSRTLDELDRSMDLVRRENPHDGEFVGRVLDTVSVSVEQVRKDIELAMQKLRTD